MHLHRGQCHAQFTGHHLVAAPLRQQLQHLRLARREVYPGQAFGDDLCRPGTEVSGTPPNGEHGPPELPRRAVQQHVALDTAVQRATDLTLSSRATTLLLHPCASNCSTCDSRGVRFILVRLSAMTCAARAQKYLEPRPTESTARPSSPGGQSSNM